MELAMIIMLLCERYGSYGSFHLRIFRVKNRKNNVIKDIPNCTDILQS